MPLDAVCIFGIEGMLARLQMVAEGLGNGFVGSLRLSTLFEDFALVKSRWSPYSPVRMPL